MDSGPLVEPVELPSEDMVAQLLECGFAPYGMTRYALWRCVTDAGVLGGPPPAHLSVDRIAQIVLAMCNSYRRPVPSTREFVSTAQG